MRWREVVQGGVTIWRLVTAPCCQLLFPAVIRGRNRGNALEYFAASTDLHDGRRALRVGETARRSLFLGGRGVTANLGGDGGLAIKTVMESNEKKKWC